MSKGKRARRFVSARRIPAGVVAAVVLAASGVLLYDVAAVRAGGQAQQWRKTLANDLDTRHLESIWVLLGAAVAAAVGLWLIWLALTPGLRAVLPMSTVGRSAGVRPGLDRKAAANVLRDEALRVPGVASARVRVGRRVVKARTRTHFRDPEEVKGELGQALAHGLRQLGLDRSLRLALRVRRADGR